MYIRGYQSLVGNISVCVLGLIGGMQPLRDSEHKAFRGGVPKNNFHLETFS